MVENGMQALERWRSGRFSLVLTDLRMPVLDGYGLTAGIRSEEPPGHRTAIIALTANAQSEERARSRAAGMDGYLIKPVSLTVLSGALEKWFPPPGGPGDKPAVVPLSEQPNAPADLSALDALVGGDPVHIQAVLRSFLSSSAKARDQLQSAISGADASAVRDITHKLKAGASSVGARELASTCAELEHAAESARVERFEGLWERFRDQLDAVRAYLEGRVRAQ
jgi:CheY-like chemotaxis protein